MNPFKEQVGGSHYKQYIIQPYEFFFHNKIPHHKAAIVRRILRYDHPTGKGLEDLNKIQHEIELIKHLTKLKSETSKIDISPEEEAKDDEKTKEVINATSSDPYPVENPHTQRETTEDPHIPRKTFKRPTLPTSSEIEESDKKS